MSWFEEGLQLVRAAAPWLFAAALYESYVFDPLVRNASDPDLLTGPGDDMDCDDRPSHSEKYWLEIRPVDGPGDHPRGYSWLNAYYGVPETKKAMLKPGWKYEIRLEHAGTNPAYSDDPCPDYDYVLQFFGSESSVSVILDDSQGLFGGNDNSGESFTGAGKMARLYVLGNSRLVPDYDRDGKIDDADVAKAEEGKVFRFWINDDEDDDETDGKYAESPSVDIPGARTGAWEIDGRDPDWDDDEVNGWCDLIDFTPIYMDVSCIRGLSKRIRDNLTFKLRHDSEAVKVVWSDLAKSSVGTFQRGAVAVCGRNLDENSYEAEFETVDAEGLEVPDALLQKMRSGSSGKGVMFIEGRKATSSPLKLDVYYGDQKVVTGELNMELSSVEAMYWFYSIRGAESNPNAPIPDGNSPDDSNLEDAKTFESSLQRQRQREETLYKRKWRSLRWL